MNWIASLYRKTCEKNFLAAASSFRSSRTSLAPSQESKTATASLLHLTAKSLHRDGKKSDCKNCFYSLFAYQDRDTPSCAHYVIHHPCTPVRSCSSPLQIASTFLPAGSTSWRGRCTPGGASTARLAGSSCGRGSGGTPRPSLSGRSSWSCPSLQTLMQVSWIGIQHWSDWFDKHYLFRWLADRNLLTGNAM